MLRTADVLQAIGKDVWFTKIDLKDASPAVSVQVLQVLRNITGPSDFHTICGSSTATSTGKRYAHSLVPGRLIGSVSDRNRLIQGPSSVDISHCQARPQGESREEHFDTQSAYSVHWYPAGFSGEKGNAISSKSEQHPQLGRTVQERPSTNIQFLPGTAGHAHSGCCCCPPRPSLIETTPDVDQQAGIQGTTSTSW